MNHFMNDLENRGNIPGYKKPTPYKRPIKRNANIIGIGILVVIFLPLALRFLISFSQPLWYRLYLQNMEIGDQVFSILYYTASFVAAIAVMMIILRIPFKNAFPLRSVRPGLMLSSLGVSRGAVILGGVLTNLVYNSLINFTGYAPVSPDFSAPRGLAANILHFISIAILPAILEEAMFRGVIMQSLRRFGDGFALIISSVLFGLIHGNFIQAPYTILAGLVMGYFVLYTGSMWPGIIIHLFNNGFSVVQDWITINTTAQQDAMIQMVFLGMSVVFSVISLIYLKTKLGSIFYVPPSDYPLEEKEKYISFFSSVFIIIVCIISIILFVTNLEPYIPAAVGEVL